MADTNVRLRLEAKITELEVELEEIDLQRAEKQARLAKLQELRAAIDGLPDDLRSEVVGGSGQDKPEVELPQGTHFERIAVFLRSRGNEPQTIAAIEDGTGIPRASVSAVLYRTHSAVFVNQDMPGTTRAKGWQLKEPEPDPFEEFDKFEEPSRQEEDIPF